MEDQQQCEPRSTEFAVPPKNFGTVEHNSLYRSSFPQPTSFSFLRSLKLKSIVCLCMEPYPAENLELLKSEGIELFQFRLEGTKELSAAMLARTMTEALKVIIVVRNHPVLIHCKSGRHRTGCLVGCLRILQNWRMAFVLEEYKQYAGAKSRSNDLAFLEKYDVSCLRECVENLLYQYLGCDFRKRHLLCSSS